MENIQLAEIRAQGKNGDIQLDVLENELKKYFGENGYKIDELKREDGTLEGWKITVKDVEYIVEGYENNIEVGDTGDTGDTGDNGESDQYGKLKISINTSKKLKDAKFILKENKLDPKTIEINLGDSSSIIVNKVPSGTYTLLKNSKLFDDAGIEYSFYGVYCNNRWGNIFIEGNKISEVE